MKTLRTLIRLDAVLLALFGYLTATYTHSRTLRMQGMVYRFDQEQAPLLFLGTAVVVLAIVLYTVSGFALIGHRRRLGTLLAAGNLMIAVVVILAQPSEWARFFGGIPPLVLLIMAMALAWTSRRPMGPDDAAAELAALQIPDDVREALLRQIGEAAAQEERNRLARDLHDSIKQQLFSINVGTAAAQERWERDPEGARGMLADVRRSAKEAMVEMQALLHQLRPQAFGSIQGLVEALREQGEAFGYRSGAQVTVALGPEIPEERMPPDAPEALFRMAQEALANAARHGRARHIRLWLGREHDTVLLRVDDDGQGFAPGMENRGMGLRNLRERAESLHGTLEIASAPAAGTRLAVRIPLAPARTAKAQRVEFWIILQQMMLMACVLLWQRVPSIGPWLKISISLIAVFFIGLLLWTWNTFQDYWDKESPRRILPLAFLFGWQMANAVDFRALWWWGLSLSYGFLMAVYWVRLYRVTGFRRFWRKGSRIWLGLIVLAETGTLLALGLAFFKPGLLTLSREEAVYVFLLGLSVLYVASREPRSEGASA